MRAAVPKRWHEPGSSSCSEATRRDAAFHPAFHRLDDALRRSAVKTRPTGHHDPGRPVAAGSFIVKGVWPLVMQVIVFEDRDRDVGAVPCGTDPELFFAESAMDVERAKLLCSRCPVRALCLAGALERREPWGVWGGELFDDGVVVARKRARGRPPRSDRAAA